MTEINWREDLAEARQDADQNDRVLLTYFWAPG